MLKLLLACVIFLASHSQAQQNSTVIEQRTTAIASELRCLVCQNQTIADSQADLAVDLRQQVHQMVRSGKSDQEIFAFMTERYGDFVVYRPPVKTSTILLWFGPMAVLAVGLGLLAWRVWRLPPPPPLHPTDRSRAEKTLNSEGDRQ